MTNGVTPEPEAVHELKLFPVSMDAVQQALREIATGGDKANAEELIRFYGDRPQPTKELSPFRVLWKIIDERIEYGQGAMLAHRIFRIQAERNRGSLPKIS